MSSKRTFPVEDDEAAKDSIAALEALMNIRRSSVDFSETQKKSQSDAEPNNMTLDKRTWPQSHTQTHSHDQATGASFDIAARRAKVSKSLPATDTVARSIPSPDQRNKPKIKGFTDKVKHALEYNPPRSFILGTTQDQPLCEDIMSSTELFIHSDKVEAALKSKPQRGKKRENLNAFERLELTRTRNREHAKSTRIRKKARYEELMDREEMYFQQKREKERDEARRKNLVLFMEYRSKLFLKPCSAFQQLDDYSRDLSTSGRIVSAVDIPGSQSSTNEPIISALYPSHFSIFEDIIDDMGQFKFDYVRDEPCGQNGLHAVECVDRSMINRFRLGNADSNLRYRIVGGSQGIGINQQGSAYAEFELLRSQKQNSLAGDGADETELKDFVLVSGMFQTDFSDESNKITAVKIFSISESEADHKILHNAYPSVVSLDHHLHPPLSESRSRLKHDVDSTNGGVGDNNEFLII